MVLDDAGFLECLVCAVFVDGLYRTSREGETDVLLEFRDVDLLCLEVELFADLASRIELGCTGAV